MAGLSLAALGGLPRRCPGTPRLRAAPATRAFEFPAKRPGRQGASTQLSAPPCRAAGGGAPPLATLRLIQSLAERGQLEEAQELLSRTVRADEDEDQGWGSSASAHPPPLSPGSTRGAEAQAYLERHLFGGPEGSPSAAPLEVRLLPSDARWPARLWLELRLKPGHTTEGRQTVQEVVACWFALGRLGAFNAANLQLQHATGPPSRARYETQGRGRRAGEPPALMHALSAWEVDEQRGLLRVGVDLGSADPLALDCLISALETLSREVVGIASLAVGGAGEWCEEGEARAEELEEGGAGEEEAGGHADVEMPYDW